MSGGQVWVQDLQGVSLQSSGAVTLLKSVPAHLPAICPYRHTLSCLSSTSESLCALKKESTACPFPLSFTCPYSALVVPDHEGPSFCSLRRCVVPHPRSPKGDRPSPLFRVKASFAPSLSTAQGVGSRSAPETPIGKASVYIGLKGEFHQQGHSWESNTPSL